jgi:hypothetical protein
MKVKFILAAALVAMFAIPGTASQLAVRNSAGLPLIGPAPVASTAGLFSDPNAVPQFSIKLPTRFVALDTGVHPLEAFHG